MRFELRSTRRHTQILTLPATAVQRSNVVCGVLMWLPKSRFGSTFGGRARIRDGGAQIATYGRETTSNLFPEARHYRHTD